MPSRRSDAADAPLEYITVERDGRVAIITLNRPQVLNALSLGLMREFVSTVRDLDAEMRVGAIVVTGSARAFAAGADIAEMAELDSVRAATDDAFGEWSQLRNIRTPLIAAVAGYALGGGCELAMACDLIVAGESARFGQPEVSLGLIPGIGGTQRLVRAVGKALAMDMILTGRIIDAHEAECAGLVARVVDDEDLMSTASGMATVIAGFSLPAVYAAKELVGRAFESSLAEGLLAERRAFHAVLATQDRSEGLEAFLHKRAPIFGHH